MKSATIVCLNDNWILGGIGWFKLRSFDLLFFGFQNPILLNDSLFVTKFYG